MLRSPHRPGVFLAAAVVVACLATPDPVFSQARVQQPATFLFINQERILTDSAAGQALLKEEEAATQQLRAEAREIDQAFEAEERRLNDLRRDMDNDEFRKIADDFDAQVIAAREEQDRRSNALAQELERNRRQFYSSVAPILVEVMERFGALAIFDEKSVLLADQSLNITDAVIAEIDAKNTDATIPPPEPATTDGKKP